MLLLWLYTVIEQHLAFLCFSLKQNWNYNLEVYSVSIDGIYMCIYIHVYSVTISVQLIPVLLLISGLITCDFTCFSLLSLSLSPTSYFLPPTPLISPSFILSLSLSLLSQQWLDLTKSVRKQTKSEWGNTSIIITHTLSPHTVLAKKSSRFYTVKLCKNVNFFWPVLYMRTHTHKMLFLLITIVCIYTIYKNVLTSQIMSQVWVTEIRWRR